MKTDPMKGECWECHDLVEKKKSSKSDFYRMVCSFKTEGRPEDERRNLLNDGEERVVLIE